MNFDKLKFIPPWQAKESDNLEEELYKEVGKSHPLYNIKAKSIAKRSDYDDVLFTLDSYKYPLAVVHLTWSGKTENNPDFPYTVFYLSIEDWLNNCMAKDNAEV
jgi:hypothetical protein